MAAPGWIKLYRTVMENDIWKSKPFSRGQAWIDLLMLANFEDKETWIDGRCVPVKRGSFITSIRKLSERWGWSRSKVSRFIDELESAQMLQQKRDTKKTTLIITNYAKYQAFDGHNASEKRPVKKPQTSHRKATDEPQTNTTKEGKEVPTVQERKNTPSADPPSEDEDELFDEDAWIDPAQEE